MIPRVATIFVWGPALAAATLLAGEPDGARRAAAPSVIDSLRPFVEKQQLAGAVTLVADRERVLRIEAIGHADVAAEKPMTTDALFWIASMTKPMTATALMILVDEGKVALDDPVEKHLPEFAGVRCVVESNDERTVLKKPREPLRVRHLLTHTSGLMSESPVEPTFDAVPLRAAVAAYSLGPLKFEPGAAFEYNNPGINVVGRIVEVASGKPYEVFMRERLFEPLGMRDTTFVPSAEQLARLAKSYGPTRNRKGLQEVPLTFFQSPLDGPNRHPFPGGGLFSTASDVAAFCRMVLNEGVHDGRRIVSARSIREMTSTQTGFLLNLGFNEQGYGFGWATARKSRGESGPVLVGEFGHGGAFNTNMWIDPERGLVTVYMTQHSEHPGIDGEEIVEAFREAAKEKLGALQKWARENTPN